MRRPARRPPLLAVLLVALLAACGYRSTLASGGAPRAAGDAPEAPRPRIAIVALRSDSPEPWLDRIVTDALRRELGGRARWFLTNEPASAELRIRGRIQPLETTSRSFSSFVAALEYSLTLALDLEVQLAGGDVVKLDATMLSETESYLASPDIEVTRTNRLEALRHLSDQLAARVADTIELLDAPAAAKPEPAGG